MGSFNAELAAKVLERRVNALESQVDGMNKASRAAGDQGANVTALQKQVADQKVRIENLEKMVKALTETRGDSKSVALEKLSKTVEEISKGRDQERNALLEEAHRKSTESLVKFNLHQFVKLQDLTKLVDEQIARAVRAQSGVDEARSQRQKAEVERRDAAILAEAKRYTEAEVAKAAKEGERVQRETVERAMKSVVDAQLTVLSARIAALEGELKRK